MDEGIKISPPPLSRTKKSLIAQIEELLLFECTDEQQEFFHKIYPSFLFTFSNQQLRSALKLVQRTVIKNKSKS